MKKILAGNANAAQRFVFESDQGALGGGVMVRTYLNKFTMAGPKTIDIRVHPNMPAGALMVTSRTLPYPLSNVGNVVHVRTRQDYYQIEWLSRARRYETGAGESGSERLSSSEFSSHETCRYSQGNRSGASRSICRHLH